jgi:hypothetical protein
LQDGGNTPQTILCEIESEYPAGTLVEAATTPSRRDVACNGSETAYLKRHKEETETQ